MIELGFLIAVSLSVVVGIAWLVRFVWSGRRYVWPQGEQRVRRVCRGYTVHVITQGEVASAELVSACATAVAASGLGWTLSGMRDYGRIGEVAIRFIPDASFDTHRIESVRRSSAYLDNIPRRFGGAMPCATVRTSLQDHVMESGDPVIHEMLCVLDGWWDRHDEPESWELSTPARPAHKRALECYAKAGYWHIQY